LADRPLPRGSIKASPDDFIVDEVSLYPPSGEGDHLYVRFTKRALTTDEVVRSLARAIGSNPRDAGVAGMKDKWAVTSQTISLQPSREVGIDESAKRLRELVLEGVTIHDVARHGHKLKPGHLASNQFAITVRDVAPQDVEVSIASLDRVSREGLPNAFGAQRFGRAGDNVERALAWVSGKSAPPRDPRMRRLLWSAVQSAIFNSVLQVRVADGTWATPLEGDLLKRRTSGGMFDCTDVQTDRERALEGEVSPTGPIVGVKMRSPSGLPGELERAQTAGILGPSFDLTTTKKLGEGTRRALRLWVESMRIERLTPEAEREQPQSLRVYFVLPKGAYATTVLASAFTLHETHETRSAPGASLGAPVPESNDASADNDDG
jgi:tRNA pseudouridine13 synthase